MLEGLKSFKVSCSPKTTNRGFGEVLQQHLTNPAVLNRHRFSQYQKPSYEHFNREDDEEDFEEDFGVVDCECDDKNKRKSGKRDSPRLNIATLLVFVLLFLVFVLLPAVYLLHCFDLLKSYWEVSDGELSAAARNKRALTNIIVTGESTIASTPPPNHPLPTHAECSVPEAKRFDCFPGEGATKENCEARGCCWYPSVTRGEEKKLLLSTTKHDQVSTSSSEVVGNGRTEGYFNGARDLSPLVSIKLNDSITQTTESEWKLVDKIPPLNVPYCFFPHGDFGHYYSWINISSSPIASFGDIEFDPLDEGGAMLEPTFGSMTGFLKLHSPSPYPKDVPVLRVDVRFEARDRLRIKIVDAEHSRYEPPYPEVPIMDIGKKEKRKMSPQDVLYRVEMDESRTGFTVLRKSNNHCLFDARSFGALIFADQFLQLSALLPSEASVYGIGEHQGPLSLPTDWQRFVLFNHDSIPKDKVILQPGPAITFRAIGGVIDLHFFLGPSPHEVVSQYTDLIGRPFMPPFWGLGFHLCRYGYKTLNRTREICFNIRKAGIPLDVQWTDLDCMSQGNDFTYDNHTFHGLPEFVEELHKLGMRYIPLIDAGIGGGDKKGTYPPYDEGLAAGVFIRNSSGLPFVGKVWNNGSTVWPDFTNPASVPYWSRQMERLHSQFPFDGVWIDMNEPSNFYSGTEKGCPTSGSEPGPYGRKKSDLEHPPYLPPVEGSLLAYNTVCMSARHFAGAHYDVHNLHGFTHAIVTSFALTEMRGKRPFVVSRSTFAGHGHYAGHWTGDVASTWADMANSVPAILNFNIFGIPLVGADICGFNGNTTIELCTRWSQLGAFYPFSRNHNTDDGIDQDPVSLGPEVTKSTRKALLIRYSLLPYLYTLFWQAHAFGDTVARPLFFEFFDDPNTHSIDKQFLWGSGLMIVPVLEEGKTSVEAYLPKGIWYDFYSKEVVASLESGHKVTLPTPIDTIPLLVRGGTILPMQVPNVMTTLTRQNKIELLVAVDNAVNAEGVLYWDDGDSLNTWEEGHYSFMTFTLGRGMTSGSDDETGDADEQHSNVEGSVLSGVLTWRGVPIPVNLGAVRVMGVVGPVRGVSANGQSVMFSHDPKTKYLVVENLSVDLNTFFIIMWY